MHLSPLAAYLFSILTTLSPIEHAVKVTMLPQAKETVEERTKRYEEIATDLAAVLDAEPKLPFRGARAKAHSGALALAVYKMESGFRKDVDLGLGKEARGGGMDTCLAQIRLGKDQVTPEGWDWRAIVADRKKCFTASLRMMRRSLIACQKEPREHGLAAYAAGVCTLLSGQVKSRARWSVYRHVVEKLGAPKDSSFVVAPTPDAPVEAPAADEPATMTLPPKPSPVDFPTPERRERGARIGPISKGVLDARPAAVGADRRPEGACVLERPWSAIEPLVDGVVEPDRPGKPPGPEDGRVAADERVHVRDAVVTR
jgi:hypothetical protein